MTLEAGDAVKLNNNNLLEKTTSAKSTDCVGIIWERIDTSISQSFASNDYFLTQDNNYNAAYRKHLNLQLSSSIYVDSLGNNKQNNDKVNNFPYNLIKRI